MKLVDQARRAMNKGRLEEEHNREKRVQEQINTIRETILTFAARGKQHYITQCHKWEPEVFNYLLDEGMTLREIGMGNITIMWD